MKTISKKSINLFKISSLSVCLLVVNACSQSISKPVQKSTSEVLEKVCFSSEGKGQFRSETEIFRFSYESRFNKKNQWIAELDIPLRGTEIFAMLPSLDRPKIGGSFGKSLIGSGAASNHGKGKLFREFLQKFSFLLMVKRGLPIQSNKEDEGQWQTTSSDSSMELSTSWNQWKKFSLNLKNLESGIYKQVRIKLLDENPAYIAPRYWEMTLLLDKCKETKSP